MARTIWAQSVSKKKIESAVKSPNTTASRAAWKKKVRKPSKTLSCEPGCESSKHNLNARRPDCGYQSGDEFRKVVPPARFQRATFRLGGGRSMQLSYGSTN